MLKSTGMVRKVDELGRVVLPVELRRTLNLPEGTPMDIFVEGEKIVLRKYAPGCVLCNSLEELHTIEGKKICMECRIKFGRTTGK